MAYADWGGSGPFASSITWDEDPGHCSEFWVDLPEFDNALKSVLKTMVKARKNPASAWDETRSQSMNFRAWRLNQQAYVRDTQEAKQKLIALIGEPYGPESSETRSREAVSRLPDRLARRRPRLAQIQGCLWRTFERPLPFWWRFWYESMS